MIDFERFASTAATNEAAYRAVMDIAEAVEADAPHLAQVLRLHPKAGGTPLLAAAFCFFLRKEVLATKDLAQEANYDSLRLLTAVQRETWERFDSGFETVLLRLEEMDVAQAERFARNGEEHDRTRAVVREIIEKLNVVTDAAEPRELTVRSQEIMDRLAPLIPGMR